MIFLADIEKRIKKDFGNESDAVFNLLRQSVQNHEQLKNDRVIRYLLFLSEKSIENLQKNIQAALVDVRDIMLWAEYENHEKLGHKRTRDFSKIFEESEIKTATL